MSILSVNAGSSSLKFALYAVDNSGTSAALGSALISGQFEGLQRGGQPSLSWAVPGAARHHQVIACLTGQDIFEAALTVLKSLLATHFASLPIRAIAHRVVHGGPNFRQSVVVSPDILTQLAALNALAPLHQPHNLAGITALQAAFPNVPQVACFDTAFHHSLPPLETTFAIDRNLTQQGVRRYGFHGLSYQYVSQVLAKCTPRAPGRVILAHLGNGASLCATLNHQSCATTMGFSALDGLMMGTRSGALDPGVLLFLLAQGWDHDRIQKLLYQQSGLLGVSGLSADMRSLRSSPDEAARFAIELFTRRVVREVGALSACIGGLDALVFTGGIGEHDAILRQDVCEAFDYLGVIIDAAQNHAAQGAKVNAIHAKESRVEVWVVPTDEGRVAAQEALALLGEVGL